MYSERSFTYNNISQPNRNKLLRRDESVDGVKTGHTEEAGYCLVASAKRGEMRLISVLLGSRTELARFDSSLALLNYGFRFYETHRLYEARQMIKAERVWYGNQKEVAIGVPGDIHVTIPRGRYSDLDASMEIDNQIEAPVTSGQQLGQINVRLDDVLLVSEPIVAIQGVGEASLLTRMLDRIKLMFR